MERVWDHIMSNETLYLNEKEISSRNAAKKMNLEKMRAFSNTISTNKFYQNKTLTDSISSTVAGVTPREMLPGFHQKTHFKALHTLALQTGAGAGALNMQDGSVDDIVKDINLLS